MKTKDFIKLLKYKPISVGQETFGIIIKFKKKDECYPYLKILKTEGKECLFHYDIVDFGEKYVNGKLKALYMDERTTDILNMTPKSKEDYKKAAYHINASLKKLYSRKNNG